jgi:uncharacterized membrane protein YeaQ/YmgE (transglycosylase-associated protein family)
MGFISFLILGIIGGGIAKLILPGKNGGWLSTVIIGVLGALLAGWVTSFFTGENLLDANGFWSWKSWIAAIIGALVVSFIWGAIFWRRRGRR